MKSSCGAKKSCIAFKYTYVVFLIKLSAQKFDTDKIKVLCTSTCVSILYSIDSWLKWLSNFYSRENLFIDRLWVISDSLRLRFFFFHYVSCSHLVFHTQPIFFKSNKSWFFITYVWRKNDDINSYLGKVLPTLLLLISHKRFFWCRVNEF